MRANGNGQELQPRERSVSPNTANTIGLEPEAMSETSDTTGVTACQFDEHTADRLRVS